MTRVVCLIVVLVTVTVIVLGLSCVVLHYYLSCVIIISFCGDIHSYLVSVVHSHSPSLVLTLVSSLGFILWLHWCFSLVFHCGSRIEFNKRSCLQ